MDRERHGLRAVPFAVVRPAVLAFLSSECYNIRQEKQTVRRQKGNYMISKPRGTMDIMPEETPLWQHIEKTVRETASKYGYEEIRTPTFESTELFARGVGDSTDVVQKEMYTFEDREHRSFTLRPEGTASVVRALIENGRCSDAMPLRLYYLISCFRYEKPQAGRSREFFQFGTEMFGSSDPSADATVISLANEIIGSLGITDVGLHINSIGCPECRPGYRKALVEYFTDYSGELCESCRERLKTNPLRILDCKSPVCSEIAKKAPKMIDYLCGECKDHFESLTEYLSSMGIRYEIDPYIVRGLDYYTRTVFEFISGGIGAQSTVCGGGRYDGLMKELGGPDLPGIGFAMGLTRLILAMKASGAEMPASAVPAVYFCTMGKEAVKYALSQVAVLREKGIFADCDIVGRSVKSQMKYADKIKARYAVVIGDNELQTGKAVLKDMILGSSREVGLKELWKEFV